MRILGLISGTSHDGIDAAVVEFQSEGHALEGRVLHADSTPYSAQLRESLLASLPPQPCDLAEVARLDTRIGQAFADAAAAAIEAAGPVDLIVSHGQTVFHWVDGRVVLGTLQIGQPAWIAERTGVPVLADVRARDIAAGGQGAPLASTLDALLLAGRAGRPAALNLGGISNATVVDPESPTLAWDIGPANALMDAVIVARDAHPAGYDQDGALAAAGTVDDGLLALLLDNPYYALQAPKSTGKELFHMDYLLRVLDAHGTRIGTEDLLATLAALTTRTVADALLGAGVTEVFVSGGGARNPVLMDGLAEAMPGVRVGTTDALGVGADEKEAVLMALLGWLTWHGVPASVPSATGAAGERILGALTPGAGPLRMPEPRSAPSAVRFHSGD
ncbi:anhydro-N-acetylmuramic acid kinase [Agrococcus sp. ProA11]|uniref:anhydro-N-acetylmuramic acid kinase n=1 Tax=Agrococcus chionoecetis TaxID=3153752 RepID=UPI00325FEEC4